ncbi:FAD-dependent oxidoreductase [Sediminivirga luteola]|nr:FAD-dependent oxidoreductase [Sediminivirga luteola]MCI2265814.1 NAD(P)/FAD-dependent oxidoreductase [Sediminivirga luteola]
MQNAAVAPAGTGTTEAVDAVSDGAVDAVAEAAAAVDVVVIGAGQAGLSAAYHLRRRGLVPLRSATGRGTFVVLDAEAGPGGAWQHRWPSLTMASVNGIHDLPGMHQPEPDPRSPSRQVLPEYFAAFEEQFELAVRRPVRVHAVRRAGKRAGRPAGSADRPAGSAAPAAEGGEGRAPGQEPGRLLVESDHGVFAARAVVNATGTWSKPFWPRYPGQETFRGRQLHVAQYASAAEFEGRRVVIVGGGVSAIQLLDEISRVTETLWVTRREPVFSEEPFDEPRRIAVINRIAERTRQGLTPESVVKATGLFWTPWARAAQARGALVRHPMFSRIEPDGVRMPDGAFEPAQAILWATGFRPALDHLAPLGLRVPGGGIRVDETRAVDEPRLFLIGYGPSASTVGANRAGRRAATVIVRELLAPAPS